LCTGIMAAKSKYFSKPMYKAYTTAVIVKGDTNIIADPQYTQSDVSLYQKIAATYVQIAKSNLVLNNTAEELKKYSPSEIRGMVTAVQNGETQIIELSVMSNNRDADTIANVYCDNFIKESMRILPIGKIEVLDHATNSYQVSTSKLDNIGIGFLLGLAVAIGIVFLKDYIDSFKIRDEKQVSKLLNIPVLITIK